MQKDLCIFTNYAAIYELMNKGAEFRVGKM
jgi:hypothetical protein